MRILLGLFVFFAGSAALTNWYGSASVDSGLAVVTGVNSKGVARLAIPAPERPTDIADAAPTRSPRFFGFALPVLVNAEDPTIPKVESVRSDSQARLPSSDPAPVGWSTDVVIYPAGRDAATGMPVVAPAQVLPPRPVAAPRDRPHPELVRELQRELRRVGCYQGDVDGNWGAASRRGMRAFMDHVSSSIQSESPDLIQLTLVRGYPGAACRAPMAPGQMMALQAPAPVPMARRTAVPVYTAAPPSALPVATVQGGAIKPTPPVVAARPPVLEGRMSVGAPMPLPTQVSAPPSLVGPPAVEPGPRIARPRAQPQPRSQTRRAERNWTRNFFDQ